MKTNAALPVLLIYLRYFITDASKKGYLHSGFHTIHKNYTSSRVLSNVAVRSERKKELKMRKGINQRKINLPTDWKM